MPSSFRLLARRLAPMGIFCCLVIVSSGSLRRVPVMADSAVAANAEAAVLPEWVRMLDLNPLQIRQVLGIDTTLHRQIVAILTTEQYTKLQMYMANDDSEHLNIYDADLGLSFYQQAALNTAFEEAITNLVNILSVEQQQLFFYNLENYSPAEPSLDI